VSWRAGGVAGAAWEGMTQVAIMLAIGDAAGAANFTHVHDAAAAHGQDGWLAWADAVVLESMSIAAGLEMRRRKRAKVSVRFPAVVLAVAVCLSLGAQVVDAERSVIGWIAAAIPVLGFLVMAKIALAQGSGPSTVSMAPGPEVAAPPGPATTVGTPSTVAAPPSLNVVDYGTSHADQCGTQHGGGLGSRRAPAIAAGTCRGPASERSRRLEREGVFAASDPQGRGRRRRLRDRRASTPGFGPGHGTPRQPVAERTWAVAVTGRAAVGYPVGSCRLRFRRPPRSRPTLDAALGFDKGRL
jgi:hypothetical protein